jgi:hypothetical protein
MERAGLGLHLISGKRKQQDADGTQKFQPVHGNYPK